MVTNFKDGNLNYLDMKNYESPVDALTDLKSRGYEANFEAESFCLYCSRCGHAPKSAGV